MTYPWEMLKPTRLEFVEDYDDIPAFLKRVRMPNGTVRIGSEAQNAQSLDTQKQTPAERPPVWPFGSNP
jgi:hypothetical protein